MKEKLCKCGRGTQKPANQGGTGTGKYCCMYCARQEGYHTFHCDKRNRPGPPEG